MVFTPVRKQHIQGFALIEAMLALFVLTIGVLGVAGLQIRAYLCLHENPGTD
jgi:Tfp pilus assembly protein PilV